MITFETKTWDEAGAKCLEKYNGTLATISDDQTMIFLKTMNHKDNQTWIGASRTSTSAPWTWQNRSPWSYSNWVPGEPDRTDTAARIYKNKGSWGLWAGAPKSALFSYLCQF